MGPDRIVKIDKRFDKSLLGNHKFVIESDDEDLSIQDENSKMNETDTTALKSSRFIEMMKKRQVYILIGD